MSGDFVVSRMRRTPSRSTISSSKLGSASAGLEHHPVECREARAALFAEHRADLLADDLGGVGAEDAP